MSALAAILSLKQSDVTMVAHVSDPLPRFAINPMHGGKHLWLAVAGQTSIETWFYNLGLALHNGGERESRSVPVGPAAAKEER